MASLPWLIPSEWEGFQYRQASLPPRPCAEDTPEKRRTLTPPNPALAETPPSATPDVALVDSRTVRAHAAVMGDLIDLPSPRSRWFADARGRSLKATWHAEAETIVLSLWESDHCIGTFQLPVDDAPQLMVLLAEAVKTWAAKPRGRAKRAVGESGSNAGSNRSD